MRFKPLVLICGSGKLGTAIAHRLYRARFRVVLAGTDDPLTLMRANAFDQAVFTGSFEVEGVTAVKAVVTEAMSLVERRTIPLLTADCRSIINVLNPGITVDARMAGPRQDLTVGDASLVIGFNEGFEAGVNCDLVIDCQRGHNLGRIAYRGTVPALPASQPDATHEVVAADSGRFSPSVHLGRMVKRGDPIGTLGANEITAKNEGVIAGLLRPETEVPQGAVIAEIDPRGVEDYCYTISDWGRCLSGSVLEALAAWVADMEG